MSPPDQPVSPATWFAPATRTSPEEIQRLVAALAQHPVPRAILDAVAGMVLILDAHRQIVAANSEALLALGGDVGHVSGQRPGEAFHCIHAQEGPGGCGTGTVCAQCDAVLSILRSQSLGQIDERECLLTLAEGNRIVPGEFRVRSTPLEIDGEHFTIFLLQDISPLKRKEALESVFFHEVLSLVGGLEGASHLLSSSPENLDKVALTIMDLSAQLTQEILSQRLLLSAERGDLVVRTRPLPVSQVLSELGRVFANHELARDRKLRMEAPDGAEILSDPVLLSRVIVGMVKNALEAVAPGQEVTVQYAVEEGQPVFSVHNPGHIPNEIQTRIFQRSFSTKGLRGRGLGTYAMKLFGERLLLGDVGFTSTPAEGTRFYLRLPAEAQLVEGTQVPTQASPGEARPEAPKRPVRTVTEVTDLARILVVDDSPTILAVMESLLGREHLVLKATSGVDALRMAFDAPPDLILMDVVMPGMDGIEACRRLKAEPRTQDIPLIFLSAMTEEADEAAGLSAGAIDYITKPVSPGIVRARVRNHLELKRYRDALKDLSMRDGLTGIPNRRRFDEYLDQEWRRAQRQGWPVSVAILDIDHFKAYNDGYGHLQGDTCLRRVAELLQDGLLRLTDLAARFGGEEFAILLPEADHQGAQEVARRLLERLRDAAIPHRFSPVMPIVTASIGLATATPGRGEEHPAFMEEADRQLYLAKATGRNRFSPDLPVGS